MDRVTFDSFARAHMVALSGFATVLTGDRDLAGDIVQDVLVDAFRHWDRFEAVEHPAAYLRRMVTNRYVSWRRRFDVRQVVTVTADVLHELSPRQHDVAPERVEQQDERARLWREMGRLSRTQRAVLVLRYYEQLSYAEIAAAVGCREDTARVVCSRALKRLRPYVTESGADAMNAAVGAGLSLPR